MRKTDLFIFDGFTPHVRLCYICFLSFAFFLGGDFLPFVMALSQTLLLFLRPSHDVTSDVVRELPT